MQDKSNALVLASSSKFRLDLLHQVNVYPDIIFSPNINEAVKRGEMPLDYVKRMSLEKLNCAIKEYSDCYIITADTIIVLGAKIIQKPQGMDHARDIIRKLSGRRHRVYTSLSVSSPDRMVSHKIVNTSVVFKNLSRVEIDSYINSQDWVGKSGGYGLQGLAGAFIKRINGSYSSVIGLPLMEVLNMLSGLGYKAT